MSDNIIKIEQAENIAKEYMKRFDLTVEGYTQDKSRKKETITIDERGYQRFSGADVVFGSIGYTHPVTDRLNATIRASGVYVHGKDFKVMTPTYLGGQLEYSF